MQIDNGTALSCVSANFFALRVFLLQLLSDKLQKRQTWWEQDPPLYFLVISAVCLQMKKKQQNKKQNPKKTAKQL